MKLFKSVNIELIKEYALFWIFSCEVNCCKLENSRMWADAQRHGRPVEYRWHHLFNAAKFG